LKKKKKKSIPDLSYMRQEERFLEKKIGVKGNMKNKSTLRPGITKHVKSLPGSTKYQKLQIPPKAWRQDYPLSK
jgi:poly-D-alanine transfer protein DltD